MCWTSKGERYRWPQWDICKNDCQLTFKLTEVIKGSVDCHFFNDYYTWVSNIHYRIKAIPHVAPFFPSQVYVSQANMCILELSTGVAKLIIKPLCLHIASLALTLSTPPPPPRPLIMCPLDWMGFHWGETVCKLVLCVYTSLSFVYSLSPLWRQSSWVDWDAWDPVLDDKYFNSISTETTWFMLMCRLCNCYVY